MNRQIKVVFADIKLEKEFSSLEDNNFIKKSLKKAITEIKYNVFCGIPIPKYLIPKEYKKKYLIKNLWKYNLPNGWRLLYTITADNEIEIIAAILEWLPHKGYEKRFKY